MPTQAPRRLLDQAQTRITKAARTTLARYLEKARQAIIHGHPPTHTADASPSDLPPNLEAWPDSQVWAQLVEQHLAPAIGVAFDEAFHAAARSDQLNIHQHRQAFMEQVYDRLSLGLWGDGVFERIRTDLAQAVDAGESIPAMQARISDELQVDKHSYLAERIARTEAHAATEGGTWSSQRAWQEATGQQLHHQWIAASDERTRPTHAAASGQRVPLEEPFTVGGSTLQYPGDPNGDPAETINCRCSTLTGTTQELDSLSPSPADIQGSIMNQTPTLDHSTPTPEPGQETEVSQHWKGVLAPLGVRGDHRILVAPEDGQVLTADHMWLSWQEQSEPAHGGKVSVGVIDKVWIQDGALWGAGRFDLADETAANVARKVAQGYAGTVSVDTTDLIDATVECAIYDRDDQPVDTTGMDFLELTEKLESGQYRVLDIISDWRLGGATLVQDPAFHTDRDGAGSAFIQSVPEPDPEEQGGQEPSTTTAADTPHQHQEKQRLATLTAAAGISPETTTWAEQVAARVPLEPPSEWFTNPNLSGPTKVRVTDQGRVYGHIACWNTNHISYNGQSRRPPRSTTNYAHYQRHRVRCADGSLILAGSIVMGTGHADLHMSSSPAMNHYDNTGHNVADVVAGEDRHGIWFSGALKPGVSALQVLTLDRYSLSGDWRNDELVGVCVVNVPGFPIPEPAAELALAASGAPVPAPAVQMRTVGGDRHALVASGVVAMTRNQPTPTNAGEASIVQAMQAFQTWMNRLDERLSRAVTDATMGAARAAREEPEIREMARQVNTLAAVVNSGEATNKNKGQADGV